jgi:hypothetical protein
LLTVFRRPNGSSIKLRPMVSDFEGAAAVDGARALISECEKTHNWCRSRSTPRLPIRVIDLSPDGLALGYSLNMGCRQGRVLRINVKLH